MMGDRESRAPYVSIALILIACGIVNLLLMLSSRFATLAPYLSREWTGGKVQEVCYIAEVLFLFTVSSMLGRRWLTGVAYFGMGYLSLQFVYLLCFSIEATPLDYSVIGELRALWIAPRYGAVLFCWAVTGMWLTRWLGVRLIQATAEGKVTLAAYNFRWFFGLLLVLIFAVGFSLFDQFLVGCYLNSEWDMIKNDLAFGGYNLPSQFFSGAIVLAVSFGSIGLIFRSHWIWVCVATSVVLVAAFCIHLFVPTILTGKYDARILLVSLAIYWGLLGCLKALSFKLASIEWQNEKVKTTFLTRVRASIHPILLLVVGLCLVCFGYNIERVRQENHQIENQVTKAIIRSNPTGSGAIPWPYTHDWLTHRPIFPYVKFGPQVTNESLRHLDRVGLRTLTIRNGGEVNDDGLRLLSGCQDFLRIRLKDLKITHQGILSLPLENLDTVHIETCEDVSIEAIVPELSGLREIKLVGFKDLGDLELEQILIQNKRLTGLSVSGSSISDKSAELILKELQGPWGDFAYFLDLSNTAVSSLPLESLVLSGNSISLGEIDLSDTKIVGAGLKSLCRCIKATYVDLNGIPITDKDMMDAADENQKVFEGCGSLGLARTKISDASVPFLDSECNALDLSHTEVTGTGFATWTNRKLTDLNLAHTQITDETLTNFPAMRLDYLDVSNTELTDKSIPHLIRMTCGENYPRIHIAGTKITAESLINSNRELTIISSSFNERDEKLLKACERIEFTRTDPYK